MSKVDKMKAQRELLARKKIGKDYWADIDANVGNKRVGFAFGQARSDHYIDTTRRTYQKYNKDYDDFMNGKVV